MWIEAAAAEVVVLLCSRAVRESVINRALCEHSTRSEGGRRWLHEPRRVIAENIDPREKRFGAERPEPVPLVLCHLPLPRTKVTAPAQYGFNHIHDTSRIINDGIRLRHRNGG